MIEKRNQPAESLGLDCIHHPFEKQALTNPQAIALVFEGKKLTYEELNARANQVARFLKKKGAGPETLVGLFVDRSFEMVIGLLGILKSGAAYIPLDPIYPKDRVAYILEFSECKLILSQSQFKDTLPPFFGEIVFLDEAEKSIAQESTENLDSGVLGRNLAYVIFTSGSTGRPKGVQIQHDGVVNFLNSMTQSPGIRADDVLLAVTTITFDISALEMFLPLSVGAAIYLVSREVSSDGEKLIQTLEKSGITIMQATPATWRLLIDSDWHGIENLKMLCGGEPLSHGLANRLLERGGELWNMYGPTETTIWSSIYKVTHESPQSVPIGRPILKTQFYVLKEDRQQVAAGEKGELYIGGAGVARGYLSLKRTEEKFFPNPFAQDGTRLYKTGDLVRELPDGNFEFFGRVDHQVKIHGFRIELNEVELALMEHPTIKHAAAVAYDAGEDDKRLAAYLVCREGQVLPDRTALREWLKAKLPHYMIPFLFIPMPSLPLMPNGKLDRQALPPISVPETTKIDPVVYTNPMEKIIYEFWRKVLGDFSFGLEDNFFETGGNSLLAVRLLSEIKKKLSVAIPAAVLLEHPTVKQLAELISNRDELSKYVLNSVFLIQRGSSSKQPLFCISGIYGDVISYQEVAGLINSEQPLWGLQIPGYEVRTSHTSIEGLADDLILAMRKAQPHGPYALVGFSFGAYVAFEMALKLQALNEKVSFLCMIDAYSPDAFQSFFSNIFFSYKLIRTLPRKTKIRYLRNAYIATRRSIVKDFKRIIFNWLSPKYQASFFSEMTKRYIMIDSYRARYYPGKIVLLKSEERVLNRKYRQCIDEVMGWGKLAKEIEIHDIEGPHIDVLKKPHVVSLAKALEQCLK